MSQDIQKLKELLADACVEIARYKTMYKEAMRENDKLKRDVQAASKKGIYTLPIEGIVK